MNGENSDYDGQQQWDYPAPGEGDGDLRAADAVFY